MGNALGADRPFNLMDLISDAARNPLVPGPPQQTLLSLASLGAPSLLGADIVASSLLGTAPFYGSGNALAPLSDAYRRRKEWNDRFAHWEKAASVTETGTIERAHSNVVAAIRDNSWLSGQKVLIERQGSYHNNTNVRTEADIDLRAVHPALKIDYDPIVVQDYARTALGYSDYGLTFEQIFSILRMELGADLSRKFGKSNVTLGKKALRIKGITGSRAEVDVVPAIRYHWVQWLGHLGRYEPVQGIALLSEDGRWTMNFPEQHAANGVAKRGRTAHRFKKVVRTLKRMRADMADRGLQNVNVPSFVIECLVYVVEDEHFLVPGDDRYSRVRRVALRIQQLLGAPQVAARLTEINEIKLLFHADQAWTYSAALTFVNAVVAHLGNA